MHYIETLGSHLKCYPDFIPCRVRGRSSRRAFLLAWFARGAQMVFQLLPQGHFPENSLECYCFSQLNPWPRPRKGNLIIFYSILLGTSASPNRRLKNAMKIISLQMIRTANVCQVRRSWKGSLHHRCILWARLHLLLYHGWNDPAQILQRGHRIMKIEAINVTLW